MISQALKIIGILLVITIISGGLIYLIREYEDNRNSQPITPSGLKECDRKQATYTIRIELLDSVSKEPVTGANITILDGGTRQTDDCFVVATPQLIDSVSLHEISDGKYVGDVTGNDKLQRIDIIIEADGYNNREFLGDVLSRFAIFREIRMKPVDE